MNFKELYGDVFDARNTTVTRNGRALVKKNTLLQEEPFITYKRKGDNLAIGIIEGIQMIAGTAERSSIEAAAPNAKHNLFGLNSFYGPRVASQMDRVITELRASANSRRAVIMVAQPGDNAETLPCTLSIQFDMTDVGELFMTVNMRSSDLVWGLPYDLIQFSLFGHAVAHSCAHSKFTGVTVFSGNSHIYMNTIVAEEEWKRVKFGLQYYFNSWDQWQGWARQIVYRRVGADGLREMLGLITTS
jgi:hypothetical protein